MRRYPPGKWADQAACRDHDPDLWFPGKGEYAKHAQAKAICMGCPVRLECLEHAIANHELQGVWGGVTFRNGKPFRKKRKVALWV